MTVQSRLARRGTAGVAIGSISSAALIAFISLSGASDGVDGLGGPIRLLTAGVILGFVYAVLFRSRPNGHPENIMTGVLIGLATWIILAVNVFPILTGEDPRWTLEAAAAVFPRLVAYLIIGGLTGALYGIADQWLGLSTMSRGARASWTGTKVVVVGGGYAAVEAAKVIDEEFPDGSVEVTMVSDTNYLVHTPMMSEVSASALSPQNISPPLRAFFNRVRVMQGEVEGIDWSTRHIGLNANDRTSVQQLPFDHVVIAAGAVPNYFGNAEVERHTFTFKSLHDAMMLRSRVIDMFERADRVQDPLERRRLLSFVVVGGGFAGVELIGGLNDFGRAIVANYDNVDAEDLRFVLIHTQEVILPQLSESLGRFAQEKMNQRGVEFVLNSRVTSARADAVVIGDREISTNTIVWTAGNRPNPLAEESGVSLSERGQIPVASTLRSQEVDGLWAAGDIAQIPDPANPGEFYPPTAQHASREGKRLGHNVAAEIRGEPLTDFEFKSLGSLAALGHQLAVAEIFGVKISGFFAWVLWRSIYVAKLPNLEKRARVVLDWILDIFFPPDIVQTLYFPSSSAEADKSDQPSSPTAEDRS